MRATGTATPGQLLVRGLLPDGLTVETTSPPATISAGSGGPTVVDWNVTSINQHTHFTIDARVRADVLPGTGFVSFFDASDGLGGSATVSATTVVR